MRTAFGAIPTRRNVAIRVTTNLSRGNLFRSFELKFCLDSPLGENIGRGATIVTILSRTLENAPTTLPPLIRLTPSSGVFHKERNSLLSRILECVTRLTIVC